MGLLQSHARYHGGLGESRLATFDALVADPPAFGGPLSLLECPMPVLRMTDLDLRGKRVLIRQDLNVPVSNGVVTSDARIRASLPTIQAAKQAGAAVMVMSHLGRPEEGVY